MELVVENFDDVDYFTDASLPNNPHPYFNYLRAQGPAVRLAHRGVVAVTGFDEGVAVFADEKRFSSFNSSYGPNPLPFTPEGDDITDQIEANRDAKPTFSLISSLDPPGHTKLKHLVMGLITPRRMTENQEFMRRISDRLIDGFIDNDGSVEFMSSYSQPFATLVVADLLGVPEEDHGAVCEVFANSQGLGSIQGRADDKPHPLVQVGSFFFKYISDRRVDPRGDVMTNLAMATYRDGSLPPVEEAVALSTFLFAAGQETTVRAIGAMLKFLGEDQALQARLRADRSLITAFVEETLRMESPLKSDFRLAKVRARIGDIEVEPGTPIMLCINAMNRDPRKFEDPDTFQMDRRNVRDHAAFGKGIHACVGAPLARAELAITLDRMFDRFSAIHIDESRHGSAGSRRYDYEPSFVVRGLRDLQLILTPRT